MHARHDDKHLHTSASFASCCTSVACHHRQKVVVETSCAMLPVLKILLKQDCLTHAASARLQVACRALAQVQSSCVDDRIAVACFMDATCNNNGPPPSRTIHTAASDAGQLHLTWGLQHALRLPQPSWQPGTGGLLSHAGRLGVRSCAAGSAASHGDGAQQSAGTTTAAQAAPTGASPSSAAPDADQQVSEEAAAAAETRELDEMLQRMTAEAEDMILGGHPLEAIQHLTEGERRWKVQSTSHT
jgi:hypothetical protein